MHTCSTSTSPPSSDQQVWWRDRLDLQHDGVVYMVENFCSRASPTNSWEGERKGSRATRVWRQGVGGEGVHQPSIYRGGGGGPPALYIRGGGGRPALAPPPILGPAAKGGRSGGQGLSPF